MSENHKTTPNADSCCSQREMKTGPRQRNDGEPEKFTAISKVKNGHLIKQQTKEEPKFQARA